MAEVPEEVMLGPRMRALASDRQRKFAWLMASATRTAAECARQAGYGDNGSLWDNSKSMVRVTAHHLAHDPRVMDAIEECTRATLRGLAPIAVKHARQILEDPAHPYHGRMIETVLDRTGHFAKTEHMVRVEHSVDMRELEALARRLAAESGVGVERLLGTNEGSRARSDEGGGKLIEGEVVDKPVDSRETSEASGGPGDAADGGRDG